jgi:hypothetical protein
MSMKDHPKTTLPTASSLMKMGGRLWGRYLRHTRLVRVEGGWREGLQGGGM